MHIPAAQVRERPVPRRGRRAAPPPIERAGQASRCGGGKASLRALCAAGARARGTRTGVCGSRREHTTAVTRTSRRARMRARPRRMGLPIVPRCGAAGKAGGGLPERASAGAPDGRDGADGGVRWERAAEREGGLLASGGDRQCRQEGGGEGGGEDGGKRARTSMCRPQEERDSGPLGGKTSHQPGSWTHAAPWVGRRSGGRNGALSRFPKTTYNVTILRDIQHTPALVPCHRRFRSICRRRSDGRASQSVRRCSLTPGAPDGGPRPGRSPAQAAGVGRRACAPGQGRGVRAPGRRRIDSSHWGGGPGAGRSEEMDTNHWAMSRYGARSFSFGTDFILPPGNVFCLFSMELSPF